MKPYRAMLFALVAAILITACSDPKTVSPPPPSEPPKAPAAPRGRDARPPLQDAGFESGELARLPVLGWYSDDAAVGRVQAAADETSKVEGARSLRVVQAHPRPSGQGLASVSQVVRMSDELRQAGRLDFEVALRGEMQQAVLAHVYVWDQNVARPILERAITVGPEWTKEKLTFEVPSNYAEFGVFLYLPSEENVRLWLDDARLAPCRI